MPDDAYSRKSTSTPGWTPPRRSPWPVRGVILVLAAAGIASLFTPFGQRAGRAVSRRLFPPGPEAEPRVIIREKIV